MEQTEHQIQSQIMEWLPYYGVYCWRNNSGMVSVGEGKYKRMIKMGQAGLPDIIGVHKPTGRLIAIEVKRPGKKPTDLQAVTIQKLKDYNALAFVATSIEDVKNELKAL
jgi:hypothetical protein